MLLGVVGVWEAGGGFGVRPRWSCRSVGKAAQVVGLREAEQTGQVLPPLLHAPRPHVPHPTLKSKHNMFKQIHLITWRVLKRSVS